MTRLRTWLIVAIAVIALGLYVIVDILTRAPEQPKAADSRRLPVPGAQPDRSPERSEHGPATSSTTGRDAHSSREATPTLVAKDLDGDMEISGRVLAPDGRPVSGARVCGCGYFRGEETGDDGRFVLRCSYDEGSEIDVHHEDYLSAAFSPIEFKPDHALTGVVITLGEGGFVAGTVTDAAGHPVDHLCIVFERHINGREPQTPLALSRHTLYDRTRTSDIISEGSTRDDGTYRSPALVAGTYTVWPLIGEPLEFDPWTGRVEIGRTVGEVDFTIRGECAVTGRVLDWDGNPIPDARIILEEASGTRGIVRSGTSAPDGAFALHAVPYGSYCLRCYASSASIASAEVQAPADGVLLRARPYQMLRGRVVDRETGRPVERFAVSHLDGIQEHPGGVFQISVAPRDRSLYVSAPGYALGYVKDIHVVSGIDPDEVLVELRRGTRLTCRVTSQTTGEPVAQAAVSVRPQASRSYSLYRLRGTAETGSDGVCSFDHFPSGCYEFRVEAEGYPPQCVLVEIPEHDSETAIDVALRPGVIVHGRVIAQGIGAPIAHATVRLLAPDPSVPQWPQTYLPTDRDTSLAEVDSQTSDENGVLTFDNVLPSEYILEIKPSETWPPMPWEADGSGRGPHGPRFTYPPQRQAILVDEPFAEELVVEVRPGGTITGSITCRDGTPADAAEVSVRAARRLYHEADAQGSYSVPGLPEGEHTVWVTHAGSEAVRTAVVQLGETTQLDISMEGFSIYGVVNLGGMPCGGVYDGREVRPVFVHARRITGSSQRGSVVNRSTLTDGNGSYRISCLDPGRYVLTARCAALGDGQDHVVHEVEIADSDVQLDIKIGVGVVSGTVFLHNGWPAGMACVELEPVSGISQYVWELRDAFSIRGQRMTNDDGTFTIRSVLPGRYRLHVSAHGHAPHVAEIVMPAEGDVTGLTIQLRPEAVVIADVETCDGQMPGAVWVAVCDGQGHFLSEAGNHVDTAAGECTIYGMGPGKHVLLAQADGYAPARVPVDVADGAETRLTLTFGDGNLLDVTVVDPNGEPVRGADVVLDFGHDPELEALLFDRGTKQQTAEDGAARFDHVADGDYTVRVRCEGYEDAAAPVTIAAQDKKVTVVLRPVAE